ARSTRNAPAPKQCGVHRLELGHEYLQGRSLSVTWTLQQPSSAAERMALRALQHLLDGRVTDQLVGGSFDAASVSTALDHHQTHSLLQVDLNLHEQTDFEKIEARVMEVASELASTPLDDAELTTLRGELVTQAVLGREDALKRALSIARGYDSLNDAELARALDSASIQGAARQLTGQRLVLAVRPSQAANDGIDILEEDNPCR
ncbi:MAG TPA: hypothetical protein VMF89_06860, partial [Polyangiales bacterium]|nr:hypothetical protein [Polyangiales bacterium]